MTSVRQVGRSGIVTHHSRLGYWPHKKRRRDTMTDRKDFGSISRIASHALRHGPWLYELELDDEGWVPVEELLSALRAERLEWSALTESDLAEMISCSDKKRHELRDGKIRALYGHSVPGRLLKEPAKPPAIL